MKKCKKCLLPETYETIEFDQNGCNICNSNTNLKKNINWKKREEDLKNLVNKFRGKYDYDCIVPYSGGKDSTFQLYYVTKILNLKPLVIRFNHGFLRKVLISAGTASALIGLRLKLYCMRKIEIFVISITIKIMIIITESA